MTCLTADQAVFVAGLRPASEGLRVAIKDVFDEAGQITSACSRALAGRDPADRDSEVVRRLKSSGCQIVGRTNMHELAFGVTGVNEWTGTPVNPRYPQLLPGGSSSGSSVAVAAGLVDFSVGTDTGGSIRMPAACCGIVGLKPTFGRISRIGVLPEQSSLDCVGPFARDVAVIELAMSIMAHDWKGQPEDQLHGIRVGWIKTGACSDIEACTRKAAANAGEIAEITLRGQEAAMQAGLLLIGFENWQAFGNLTETCRLGSDVESRLRKARDITLTDVARARATRVSFAGEVDQHLALHDVLAIPTLAGDAPELAKADDPAAMLALTANARPFNLSGHPAIALPVGEVRGRPVSLQLIGRRGEDERLCAIARTIPLASAGDKP